MCLGLPVSLLAFGIATDFHGDLRDLADPESLVGTLSPVAYVTLLVLPGQAVLLLLSLGAALLSREPFLRRLGLVRPRVSLALLPFFVLVALLAGWAGGILAGRVFGEESAHLQELERVILEPQGLAMLYVLLCLSITPGVTEELLYRAMSSSACSGAGGRRSRSPSRRCSSPWPTSTRCTWSASCPSASGSASSPGAPARSSPRSSATPPTTPG
jgi:hypothetical protein